MREEVYDQQQRRREQRYVQRDTTSSGSHREVVCSSFGRRSQCFALCHISIRNRGLTAHASLRHRLQLFFLQGSEDPMAIQPSLSGMSTPDPTSTSLYPTPDPSTPAALHPNGPSTSMYPTPTPLQLKSPTPTSAPPPPAQPRAQPNYKLAQTIYAHKRAVTALRWTRDGRGLVTAGTSLIMRIQC